LKRRGDIFSGGAEGGDFVPAFGVRVARTVVMRGRAKGGGGE